MDYFASVNVFIQVVQSGSFVKASEVLGLPRNTVTRQVQNLESHLRVKLLNRTTRRISLTNDGLAYFEQMSKLVEQWLAVESELICDQAKPRGRLRIDMGSTMASCLVLPNLKTFLARYPQLQIDMGVSDRPVDVLSDRVDCAIYEGTIKDTSLVARKLGAFDIICAASPDYLEEFGVPQHPEELGNRHKMVRYFLTSPNQKMTPRFMKGNEVVEVDGGYFVSVNDLNAFLSVTLAGLGIAQLPAFMTERYIKQGSLTPVLTDWSAEPNPIHIVYPPNRHLSARVRVFADWLVELFEEKVRRQIPSRNKGSFKRSP